LKPWSKAKPKSPQPTATPPPDTSKSPVDHRFGLRVLYGPRITATDDTQTFPSVNTTTVDLIYVHGLGGSAKETWTHAVSKGFWPDWLHEDSRFDNVRISTFGYDANFKNVLVPQNALGITDFAYQLLESLDLHFHKYNDVNSILLMKRLIIEPHYFCGA
jgi:hypothetical protein